MAETLQDRQDRIALELQALLTETYPAGDFDVGTVNYDLLVVPASLLYATQELELDTVRDNLSLSQVLRTSTPDPTLVDNLLSNFGVTRDPGTVSVGLINVFSSAVQNLYIPANTKFECSGIRLQPAKSYVGVPGTITEQDTPEVSYVQMRDVDATTKVFTISATTVEPATTVISTGQACTSSLNNPQISKLETGSTFTGGQVEETTLELLDRARTGVNARVVTGRDNIRALMRTQSAVNIIDSAVFGMGDALQLRDAVNNTGISAGGRVDVYIKTVPVPVEVKQLLTGTRVSGNIWDIEISSDAFPGAYGISRLGYADLPLDVGITYTLGYAAEGPWPLISTALQARYSKYQTLHVGFETTVVDSAIDTASFEVTVIYMPGVATLQDFFNDADVRSYTFDHVVKASIPVIVDLDVDIEYPMGVEPPTVGSLQQSISDIINLKAVGTEALFASDIVYATRLAFVDSTVRMPVNLRAQIYMPDGTVTYTSSQNHIKAPEVSGISFRNTAFFCFPHGVNVNLSEVS
jgi:hypothetical protein